MPDQRYALLLEFLPNARMMDSYTITKKLAFEALAGIQAFQQVLVRHGDESQRNLLVTGSGRVVWVDFDRADVFDRMNEILILDFRQDIIRIHRMLFTYMVSG